MQQQPPDESSARRIVPDPGFAGDEGAVDPAVSRALRQYAADRDYLTALETVQGARLLVPVVATLGEVEYDEAGLAHDKTSDMATVLITGADGRRALLAFTGTESLTAWRPDARPVPVTLADAAKAARHDGADALLLDVAGPVMFPIEGAHLEALAEGHVLVRVEEQWAWARLES